MSNDPGRGRPNRTNLWFWLLIILVIAALNLLGRAKEREAQPLEYADFQAGWNPKKKLYSGEGDTPLYDRAELKYGQRRLDLRAAKRDGDAETWYRVEVPSNRELTGEFFERLKTIQEFEHSPAQLYWSLLFNWRTLGILAVFWALVGSNRVAKHFKQTRLFGPAIVASLGLGWLYLLHTGVLPGDWAPTLRENIFEQGSIPYLTVWVTLFGLAYVLQIYAVYGHPYKNQEEFDELLERLNRLYRREGDISAVQRLRDEILEGHERAIYVAFTEVRYAEWILPVLGFLGTVIGLGEALGHMQEAVKFTDEGVVIAPDQLNRTFGGMALAFYTTLWGFLGMLAVGLAHYWLRKKIEQALTEVSIRLTGAIENAPNQPSTVKVVAMPPQRDAVRMAAAVEELYEQQSQVAELLLRCVREDPALYERFGPILFEDSIVSSAEYDRLSLRIMQEIGKAVEGKSWEIEALGAAPAEQARCGGLIVVDHGREGALCLFDVVGGDGAPKGLLRVNKLPRPCDRLVLCDPASLLLRSTADPKLGPRLYWWRDGNLEGSPAHDERARDSDLVIPVPAGNGLTGAVVAHGDLNNRKLTCVPAQRGSKPYELMPAVQGANWTLGAFAPDGQNLALAGEDPQDHHWKLLIFPAGGQGGSWKLDNPDRLPLSQVENLEQIEWLSPDELLLVGQEGHILLFDIRSRQAPEPLQHAEWHATAGTRIRVGPDRWFAVFRTNRLSMWRVTLSGGLVPSPNREWLEASHIRPPRMAVANGSKGPGCLVGAYQQLVTVWNFPHQRTVLRERPAEAKAAAEKE